MSPLRSPTRVVSRPGARARRARRSPGDTEPRPRSDSGVGRQWLIAASLAAALIRRRVRDEGRRRSRPQHVGADRARAHRRSGRDHGARDRRRRVRRYGLAALVLFALLALLTTLSITWSVTPDTSWLEANRTLSYFAVFGAGMALRAAVPRAVAGARRRDRAARLGRSAPTRCSSRCSRRRSRRPTRSGGSARRSTTGTRPA